MAYRPINILQGRHWQTPLFKHFVPVNDIPTSPFLGETIGRSLYDRLNDVAPIEAGVSFQLSAVESKP